MGGNKKADCKAVPHSGDKSQEVLSGSGPSHLLEKTSFEHSHTKQGCVVGITLKELSCMYAFVEGIFAQMVWINKSHVPHWPLRSCCFTHIPNS